MPKRAKELTGPEIKRLAAPGWHAVGHVLGLGIQISGGDGKSWVLRTVDTAGKRRALGLGSYPSVDLDMARTKARVLREQIKAGTDPVAEARRAQRAAQVESTRQRATFRVAAAEFLEARAAGWKNDKHAAQWQSTLDTYAFPLIGDMPVADIAVGDVLRVLQQKVPKKGAPKERGPLWVERAETASRVRQRIEVILDAAKVRGYRTGDNPAAWRGNLDSLLAKPSEVATVKHHDALAWQDIPTFMQQLRAREGMAARALELAILCANRSQVVRGAIWAEFDLDAGVWVIQAERMKGRRGKAREHRIPLSEPAVALLRSLPKTKDQPLVFPSPTGKMFSDAAMGAVLKRMDVDVTQHGFRSTFRDWAAETTAHPNEVAEMALAHAVGSDVEAAYRRGDLFAKRRALMTDWAAYCARTDAATVTRIAA